MAHRPRTHKAWQELAQWHAPKSMVAAFPRKPAFTPAQLEELRAVAPEPATLMPFTEAEELYSAQLEQGISALESKLREPAARRQRSDNMLAMTEPDWVFYKNQLDEFVDITYLRERILTPGSDEDRKQILQESREATELLRWFRSLTREIEAHETDRLKSELKEELAQAEDKEEESLIQNYYQALLTRVPSDVSRKLQILTAIQNTQPSITLGNLGVPSLPGKEKLKDWYEVDVIDSYIDEKQRQKLQRYLEVVPRELRRISSFPNPNDHLKKLRDWEVFTATSEQDKREALEAFHLRLDAYKTWENSTWTPEDENLRWKDAVAIRFLRSKGVPVPDTRRELYEEIEDLNQEEYEQYLRDEEGKRNMAIVDDYRARHPHGALTALYDTYADLSETLYDHVEDIAKHMNSTVAVLTEREQALRAEIDSFDDTTFDDVLQQHPDWEEDIRSRINAGRWDMDVPDAAYDKDEAKIEAQRKIWWEPFHHHGHDDKKGH